MIKEKRGSKSEYGVIEMGYIPWKNKNRPSFIEFILRKQFQTKIIEVKSSEFFIYINNAFNNL